ncbi:hypothetical protein ACFOQM_10725 [Paenibacillus sp. GCM10012307]|uniref:Uncharacterized protein n=2 Tax=Paenibacillus TaxID=44249 RepID=A0A934J576_9BACL|nr:hypothetical protein [Paenibacillus roseus]MBJ6361758.1 hypothetical protein [Paenibacillus roseus]
MKLNDTERQALQLLAQACHQLRKCDNEELFEQLSELGLLPLRDFDEAEAECLFLLKETSHEE